MGEIYLYPPGGPMASGIGYAEVLANQTGITALVALTGLTTTVTIPAGRRIKVTAEVAFTSSVAADNAYLAIYEDATLVRQNRTVAIPQIGTPSSGYVSRSQVIFSPAAGTHTYSLYSQRNGGTGSISVIANATTPAFILVEDITGTVWPTGSPVTAGMVASEAWTPYPPVWAASGTQPAIGNGTLIGRYGRIGRTVFGTIYHLMGSTTTYGTGSYTWSLPAAPATATSIWVITGGAKGYQGGNSINTLSRVYNGTAALQCPYSATWPAGTETNVGQLTPWTWATGNTFDINFRYEAVA